MNRLAVLALTLLLALPSHAQDRIDSGADSLTLWHEAQALLPTQVLLPGDLDPTGPRPFLLALEGYGSSADAFLLTSHCYEVEFRAFDGGHTVPADTLDLAVEWIRERRRPQGQERH